MQEPRAVPDNSGMPMLQASSSSWNAWVPQPITFSVLIHIFVARALKHFRVRSAWMAFTGMRAGGRAGHSICFGFVLALNYDGVPRPPMLCTEFLIDCFLAFDNEQKFINKITMTWVPFIHNQIYVQTNKYIRLFLDVYSVLFLSCSTVCVCVCHSFFMPPSKQQQSYNKI